MKLLLINPRSSRRSGLNLHNGGYFQPLALATIAGATPGGWEIEVQDENWQPAEIRPDVDLVGITAFTSSIPRAYELAAEYRRAGVPTVLGGVHALARQQEAAEHFDAVVLREADVVWRKALQDAEAGQLQKFYQGGLVSGDFAEPRRDVLDPRYRYASVQISRGCPMGCSFCSVPWFSGHTIRRQRLERTIQDLMSIRNRAVFFVDDNLVGYGPHDRACLIELLEEMVRSGFSKPWMCQASINITDDEEVLSAMSEAGCKLIMIGIEARDAAGLASVRKRLNQRYVYDFSKIHAAGMSVLGFFILGLDTDSPDVMRERVKEIHRSGVDAWQITILTPLPGTQFFHEMYCGERLLYTNFPNDWGRYDFVDATFVPPAFLDRSHFRDVLAECLMLAYDEHMVSEIGLLTRDRVGDITATTLAIAANMKYGAIARQRMAEEVTA